MYSVRQSVVKEASSKGASVISKRWKVDVKEMVNKYDFHYHSADHNEYKCEFCGNKLHYVAYIEGSPLTNPDGEKKRFGIGFDCLTLVFGTSWHGYTQAKREIAYLKKLAAIARRKEKNAVDYADIISWLNSLHPTQISRNKFLKDMKHILETGNKPFSINMESGIRSAMEKIKPLDSANYDAQLKRHKEVVIPNLEKLLDMICEVDNLKPHSYDWEAPKYSSFGFVKNVLAYAKTVDSLSQKQKDALNRVWKRYEGKKKSIPKKVEIDTSNLPY